MYTDLHSYQIKNKLLLAGLIVGSLKNLLENGIQGLGIGLVSMLIPFILLYPLFLIRAFGAGDIKMMCVIALFMTPKAVLSFMMFSFIIGGVISIFKLIVHGNLISRLRKFFYFLKYCFLYKTITEYEEPFQGKAMQCKNVIHFSIPIAISTFMWLGGVYV